MHYIVLYFTSIWYPRVLVSALSNHVMYLNFQSKQNLTDFSVLFLSEDKNEVHILAFSTHFPI